MERYTKEQRVFVITTFFENGKSFQDVIRKFRTKFGRENAPTNRAIKLMVDKFLETGSVLDNRGNIYQRSGRSTENVAAVSRSVEEDPKTSIRHRSQQLNIKPSTLFNILHRDLHLKAYKIQLTQELKPTDHALRRQFVSWAIEKQEENENFFNKIIFTDEAHFQLNGYVNKQNCRIWGEENPRVILEQPLHPQKVTVWCGLWSGGIIGPYFFENANGNTITVNGNRYREMIRSFLWREIDDLGVENMWFQQDGATCHTARETMDLLKEKFEDRIISRRAGVNWPARSCDLTPLDFFLWGFVKSKVYRNNPTTIQELKNNIIEQISTIDNSLLNNVIQNFGKRLEACRSSRGGHLADIIFHY